MREQKRLFWSVRRVINGRNSALEGKSETCHPMDLPRWYLMPTVKYLGCLGQGIGRQLDCVRYGNSESRRGREGSGRHCTHPALDFLRIYHLV